MDYFKEIKSSRGEVVDLVDINRITFTGNEKLKELLSASKRLLMLNNKETSFDYGEYIKECIGLGLNHKDAAKLIQVIFATAFKKGWVLNEGSSELKEYLCSCSIEYIENLYRTSASKEEIEEVFCFYDGGEDNIQKCTEYVKSSYLSLIYSYSIRNTYDIIKTHLGGDDYIEKFFEILNHLRKKENGININSIFLKLDEGGNYNKDNAKKGIEKINILFFVISYFGLVAKVLGYYEELEERLEKYFEDKKASLESEIVKIENEKEGKWSKGAESNDITKEFESYKEKITEYEEVVSELKEEIQDLEKYLSLQVFKRNKLLEGIFAIGRSMSERAMINSYQDQIKNLIIEQSSKKIIKELVSRKDMYFGLLAKENVVKNAGIYKKDSINREYTAFNNKQIEQVYTKIGEQKSRLVTVLKLVKEKRNKISFFDKRFKEYLDGKSYEDISNKLIAEIERELVDEKYWQLENWEEFAGKLNKYVSEESYREYKKEYLQKLTESYEISTGGLKGYNEVLEENKSKEYKIEYQSESEIKIDEYISKRYQNIWARRKNEIEITLNRVSEEIKKVNLEELYNNWRFGEKREQTNEFIEKLSDISKEIEGLEKKISNRKIIDFNEETIKNLKEKVKEKYRYYDQGEKEASISDYKEELIEKYSNYCEKAKLQIKTEIEVSEKLSEHIGAEVAGVMEIFNQDVLRVIKKEISKSAAVSFVKSKDIIIKYYEYNANLERLLTQTIKSLSKVYEENHILYSDTVDVGFWLSIEKAKKEEYEVKVLEIAEEIYRIEKELEQIGGQLLPKEIKDNYYREFSLKLYKELISISTDALDKGVREKIDAVNEVISKVVSTGIIEKIKPVIELIEWLKENKSEWLKSPRLLGWNEELKGINDKSMYEKIIIKDSKGKELEENYNFSKRISEIKDRYSSSYNQFMDFFLKSISHQEESIRKSIDVGIRNQERENKEIESKLSDIKLYAGEMESDVLANEMRNYFNSPLLRADEKWNWEQLKDEVYQQYKEKFKRLFGLKEKLETIEGFRERLEAHNQLELGKAGLEGGIKKISEIEDKELKILTERSTEVGNNSLYTEIIGGYNNYNKFISGIKNKLEKELAEHKKKVSEFIEKRNKEAIIALGRYREIFAVSLEKYFTLLLKDSFGFKDIGSIIFASTQPLLANPVVEEEQGYEEDIESEKEAEKLQQQEEKAKEDAENERLKEKAEVAEKKQKEEADKAAIEKLRQQEETERLQRKAEVAERARAEAEEKLQQQQDYINGIKADKEARLKLELEILRKDSPHLAKIYDEWKEESEAKKDKTTTTTTTDAASLNRYLIKESINQGIADLSIGKPNPIVESMEAWVNRFYNELGLKESLIEYFGWVYYLLGKALYMRDVDKIRDFANKKKPKEVKDIILYIITIFKEALSNDLPKQQKDDAEYIENELKGFLTPATTTTEYIPPEEDEL